MAPTTTLDPSLKRAPKYPDLTAGITVHKWGGEVVDPSTLTAKQKRDLMVPVTTVARAIHVPKSHALKMLRALGVTLFSRAPNGISGIYAVRYSDLERVKALA